MNPVAKRSVSIAIVSGFLIAGVASPAVAASFDLDNDGVRLEPFTWVFASDPFGVVGGSYSMGGVSYTNAWDSTAFSVWSEDENNESVDPPTSMVCPDAQLTETGGDYTISCDAVPSAIGLDLRGEVRLYGEGDMVRTLVTLSNPTSAPIEFSWSFTVDYYGGTALRATSSTPHLGAVATTADDTWSYNAEPNSVNAVTAWGLSGAALPVERVREFDSSTLALISDRDVDGTQTVIGAGDSVTLAFFQKLDPMGTAASRSELADENEPDDSFHEPSSAAVSSSEAIQSTTAEFADFSGRLARGISDDVVVANWQPQQVAEQEAGAESELAETGSDQLVAMVLVIIAGTLMAVGAVLLVVRRRAGHSSGR